LALGLSESDAFGADAKANLGVVVIGAGDDMRPVTAPGQPFLFTIGLDNMKGVADAHHVILRAVLPNGLKFQSSEPAPTRVENGNHPVWEIDTLPAKALPRLFQVTAETDANQAPGNQLEISAEAESSEGNANSADNHASYKIYVQALGPALVLLGSTLDSMAVTAETPTTFNVYLKNAGNLPSTGTRLEATLPKGMKLDKADPKPALSSGEVVSFKLGDLERGESRAVSMTVAFDSRQLPELLTNDRPLTFAFRVSRLVSGAEVTDSRFEVAKHIESAGQDVAVWLVREGEAGAETPPEKDISYVIKFANLGNQNAHKAVVALFLGPGLSIAHSDSQLTGTEKNDAFPGGIAHWDVGELGVGMSGNVRSAIHATSIPNDGALLSATITADGIDLDTTNNVASVLWHNPPVQGTLKSARRSAAVVKPVAMSEKANAHPASHRWRYFIWLILVIVALVIFFRARR